MDYLDTIQKYMDGKTYAHKNIKTSDKIGYVTDTGVSKQYASMDVYNATAGKNNCPSDFIQLTPSWSELGFPVGSLMKSGQSCGNENKYVQASPPSNNFDWKFYIETYSPKGVTTEQEARDHWDSIGKPSGLLPNANIITSMRTLGKVGYIDVDTQFHTVPVTAKSSYKSFPAISNVTGDSMEDCSRPTPKLKYGKRIVLTYQDKTGYINNTVFKFGTKTTSLFLRPPPGEDSQQGKPVKYGDVVCLSSSSSSYTTECGWWGCKVASINTSTNQMEFGPGGNTTTTFQINPPKDSIYPLGSDIKYGDPFIFMTISTTNLGNLSKGDSVNCKTGTEPSGMSTQVYRYSGNNTLHYYPTTEIANSWNAGSTVDVDCSTYTYGGPATMLNVANLSNGDTVGCNSGQNPPDGVQGGIYRYVDDNVLRWYPTPSIASSWNPNWYSSIKRIDCKTYTVGEPMTDQMESSNSVETEPQFAYVSNNIIKFGSWSESKNANVFSVQYTETTPDCNIDKLKQSCKDNCIGFIHSPETHTWQKITPTSKYKITPTVQDMYIKENNVNVEDSSCTKSDIQFIDPTLFSNYAQGKEFQSTGTGQCKVLSPLPTYTTKTQTIDSYKPVSATLQQHHQETTELMKSKTIEYQSVLQKIKNAPPMTTLEQQYKDMSLFDKQHKLQLVLWAILSVSIVTIILIRK